MKLVHVQEGFVWLPTVKQFSKSCPPHFELHSASLGSITSMTVNRFDHKLLFVVLRYHEWRCSGGIVIERSQVVDMGRRPFSIN